VSGEKYNAIKPDTARAEPFDFAQAMPFDCAQAMPFDSAQGMPLDRAQGMPFDCAQFRHRPRPTLIDWNDSRHLARVPFEGMPLDCAQGMPLDCAQGMLVEALFASGMSLTDRHCA
jgi:hypothetical protein